MLRSILEHKLLRPLLAGVIFGGLYASWAWFANLSDGVDAAQRATLVQYVVSFVIALIFTASVDHFHEISVSFAQHILLVFLLPMSVLVIIVSSAHFFSGTPNVLLTILPSVSVAAIYCLSRVFKAMGHERPAA